MVGLGWGPRRVLQVNLVQPVQSIRDQGIADVGHRVDDPVGDDQWPQPTGALPRVAEYKTHHDVAQPGAEALIQVVGAA